MPIHPQENLSPAKSPFRRPSESALSLLSDFELLRVSAWWQVEVTDGFGQPVLTFQKPASLRYVDTAASLAFAPVVDNPDAIFADAAVSFNSSSLTAAPGSVAVLTLDVLGLSLAEEARLQLPTLAIALAECDPGAQFVTQEQTCRDLLLGCPAGKHRCVVSARQGGNMWRGARLVW